MPLKGVLGDKKKYLPNHGFSSTFGPAIHMLYQPWTTQADYKWNMRYSSVWPELNTQIHHLHFTSIEWWQRWLWKMQQRHTWYALMTRQLYQWRSHIVPFPRMFYHKTEPLFLWVQPCQRLIMIFMSTESFNQWSVK